MVDKMIETLVTYTSTGFQYIIVSVIIWLGTGWHIWKRSEKNGANPLHDDPTHYLPFGDLFLYAGMVIMALALFLVGTAIVLAP